VACDKFPTSNKNRWWARIGYHSRLHLSRPFVQFLGKNLAKFGQDFCAFSFARNVFDFYFPLPFKTKTATAITTTITIPTPIQTQGASAGGVVGGAVVVVVGVVVEVVVVIDVVVGVIVDVGVGVGVCVWVGVGVVGVAPGYCHIDIPFSAIVVQTK